MRGRMWESDSPSQSARGLAQSKTLREFVAGLSGRQLLDCTSPLALSDDVSATSNRHDIPPTSFSPPTFLLPSSAMQRLDAWPDTLAPCSLATCASRLSPANSATRK